MVVLLSRSFFFFFKKMLSQVCSTHHTPREGGLGILRSSFCASDPCFCYLCGCLRRCSQPLVREGGVESCCDSRPALQTRDAIAFGDVFLQRSRQLWCGKVDSDPRIYLRSRFVPRVAVTTLVLHGWTGGQICLSGETPATRVRMVEGPSWRSNVTFPERPRNNCRCARPLESLLTRPSAARTASYLSSWCAVRQTRQSQFQPDT